MDPVKHAEEMLREAACFGDEDAVKALIKSGVNVNVQHSINGWTPLHWATKRGHTTVVRCLMSAAADPTLTSARGETPLDLAANDEIKVLLSGGKWDSNETSDAEISTPSSPSLPITPNYISNPPLAHKVEIPERLLVSQKVATDSKLPIEPRGDVSCDQELVVKVRTADPPNQDFIEVEIPYNGLSFANLLKICCKELEVNMQKVVKLRKLPNTILRKDKDVFRLKDFVELEVVLLPDEYLDSSGCFIRSSNSPPNGFAKVISVLNNNTKAAPGAATVFQKSVVCSKDGILLY